MTSLESPQTAPSTQPPETEPITTPPDSTASAAPGSRGALRNVATTVARANVSSPSHHVTIVSRMSRTAPPRSLPGFTTLRQRHHTGLPWFSNWLIEPERAPCYVKGSLHDLGDRDLQDVAR